MSQTYNLYCDESCHLENDRQSVMVLGALWCLRGKTREIAVRLREIKAAHGLPPEFEVKAYCVAQPHRQNKLRREYEGYWKAQKS